MPRKQEWTRQQLLVAFTLYCDMPFGKMHARNPEIIKFAGLMQRTPSALAMKLTNIASLDPAITSTNRSGLENASAADRAMWEEMHADSERFSVEAQDAISALGMETAVEASVDEWRTSDEVADYSASNRSAQTMVRLGQNFFRRSVLNAYEFRCCITRLAVPSLLVASHIVPWQVDASNRLNPRNGLCLSVLHDKAFDTGIITITDDMTVRVSKRYSAGDDHFLDSALLAYDGLPIAVPKQFQPDPSFLSHHRQHTFQN